MDYAARRLPPDDDWKMSPVQVRVLGFLLDRSSQCKDETYPEA